MQGHIDHHHDLPHTKGVIKYTQTQNIQRDFGDKNRVEPILDLHYFFTGGIKGRM